MSKNDQYPNPYGYPKCCVKFFWDNCENLEIINLARDKEIGVAYQLYTDLMCIPCEKCYEIVKRRSKQYSFKYTLQNEIKMDPDEHDELKQEDYEIAMGKHDVQKVICASCGEELNDEDLANTTCLLCGGEAK